MSNPCCCTDNWPDVEAASKAALTEPICRYIEECRQAEHPESHLISILHKVQAHFGYLDAARMDAVAQLLRAPAAKVSGVSTFYHYFRLKPRGTYIINVCLGTACYVKGANSIIEVLRQVLGIDFGETTPDGMFSLEATRCLGTCGLAPVIMVNDEIHGKLRPDQIPALIEDYREKTTAVPA